MQARKLVFAVGAMLLSATAMQGQSPFAPKVTGPLSQRVVAYQIDATYVPDKHEVDATETLTYHNLTGKALDHFPFHLYLNAFQPTSTWVREAHRDGNFRTSSFGNGWDPKHTGSNDVISLEVVGMGDLTKQMKFISPDDGNPDDKTVMDVALPRPVEPGQDVTFKIKFRAYVPGSRRPHRLQAHLPARRTVVSESGSLVERRMELPPISCHDRVLRRLRNLRREHYVAQGLRHRRDWCADPRYRQRQRNKNRRLPRRRCPRLRLDRRPELQSSRRAPSTAAWDR